MQPNDETQPTDQQTPTPEAAPPANPTPEATVITPSADAAAPSPVTETPAAQDPVPSQQTPVPAPVGGKRKKLKLLVAIVGLVLLLGGGGAAAYYTMILPNQPERVTQQAITNTLDQEKVHSMAFEGEVNLEGGEASQAISGITFNGSSNHEGAMQANISVNTLVTKIGLDLKSEDGKTIYLKLSGLDGLDQLIGAYAGAESAEQASAIATLISSVNDQWYMLDQSLLSQLGGDAANLESTLSTEDAKKIGEIYKKHQFLNIDKKLEAQDIHGVKSHHLQVSVNKDQMVSFLNGLKAANISSLPVGQSAIDELSKVDFSKYPFEMWVSKKDRFITQLATTIEEQGTKYKVRVALFDYNKPVSVEKPTDAKSILELLGDFAPLAGGLTGGIDSADDLPLQLQ